MTTLMAAQTEKDGKTTFFEEAELTFKDKKVKEKPLYIGDMERKVQEYLAVVEKEMQMNGASSSAPGVSNAPSQPPQPTAPPSAPANFHQGE